MCYVYKYFCYICKRHTFNDKVECDDIRFGFECDFTRVVWSWDPEEEECPHCPKENSWVRRVDRAVHRME